MKHLDRETALAITPFLCDEHREEILRTHADLESWAIGRAELNGVAYAIEDRSGPVLIGGVIDRGHTGYLWIAGVPGWQRHLRAVMRVFREVLKAKVYRYLECECFEDNAEANWFARRLGFNRLYVKNNLVYYGMAL